jgi:tetraacyldisaccharide 4'-kinase
LNQEYYHKLISGQVSGLWALILRLFLAIAAVVYSIVIGLRNFLYSKGWLKIHRANAPVISVGNITAGGTGKTPLVVWLCGLLRQKDVPCAILTRGYKTAKDPRPKTQDYGDEPAILIESCPEAKVIVNPDRVAGAAEAVNKFDAKTLVMDDGFQHRRLGRDLDIVTIDATRPFGYGRMLPAGLLREPLIALKRANAVVITRCDQTTEAKLTRIEEKLQQVNHNMIIARSIHAAVYAKSTNDKEIGLEELKDKKIFAFCGIGNPDAFLNTIKALGSELAGSKVYNDHHHYTDDCLADIYEQATHLKADLILTTQKDWTKITQLAQAKKDMPLAYLAIEIKLLVGEDKLRGLIEDTLASKIPMK